MLPASDHSSWVAMEGIKWETNEKSEMRYLPWETFKCSVQTDMKLDCDSFAVQEAMFYWFWDCIYSISSNTTN